MINWILPLFRFSFWFNMSMVPFMPWLERSLPIFLAALAAAGVGMLLFSKLGKGLEKTNRRFWRQSGTAALLSGLTGLLLLFFHWQRVPVLTMRILWVVWGVGYGYWGFAIWKEHFKILPAERAKAAERAAYEKWLPKPKK